MTSTDSAPVQRQPQRPSGPRTVTTSFRMTRELRQKGEELARSNGITFSMMMIRLLQGAVAGAYKLPKQELRYPRG